MNRSKRHAGWLALGAASAALAGCATPRPQTSVTRFHLQQPIARGRIAVESLVAGASRSLEYRAYADAVGGELARLAFTVAPGVAQSELVAVVAVDRGTREGLAQRSPVSIGLGAGGVTGGGYRGGGLGLGGGISFPIGRARSRYVTITELSVQLKRRSDGTVIWEGRAQQAARADSADADPAITGATLARALFQDFPGESGRTVVVR